MTCEILRLEKDSKHWKDFLRLPDQIYEKDPHYCKRPIETLRAECHHFQMTRDALPLLAVRNNKPVARLITMIDLDLRDYQKGKTGLIGFFESENRKETVDLILDHTLEWLKRRGVHKVVGPINGDTWHTYRFNCGPYDQPPFMMEPYNPSYYPVQWERYGFSILSTYHSKRISDVQIILPKLESHYERAIKDGFSFRPFNLRHYEDEMHLLYDLSCRIFSHNPFYSEIKEEEFGRIYAGAKSIIDRRLFWFCADKSGRHAGFIFSFPDFAEAVRSMNGKTNPVALLKFLLNRRKADTLNLKTVGVDQTYRGAGLGTALMYKAYYEGVRKGFKKAHMCLFHQDNLSGRIDGGKGEIMRTYHLYEYEIP